MSIIKGRLHKGNGYGNCLCYKGYVGSVELSEKDTIFHGKVIGIKALISFEGDSVNKIIEDFHNAVDEYLKFCTDKGKEPEKAFKRRRNLTLHVASQNGTALAF